MKVAGGMGCFGATEQTDVLPAGTDRNVYDSEVFVSWVSCHLLIGDDLHPTYLYIGVIINLLIY